MKRYTPLLLLLGILIVGSVNTSLGSSLGSNAVSDWTFYSNSWITSDTDSDGYNDQISYEFWVDSSITDNLTVLFEVFDMSNTSVYSNTQMIYATANGTFYYSDSWITTMSESFYLEISVWDSTVTVFSDKTPIFALYAPLSSITAISDAYSIDTGVDTLPDTIVMSGELSWNAYDISSVSSFSILFDVYYENVTLMYSNSSTYYPTSSTDTFSATFDYSVPYSGDYSVRVQMLENNVTVLHDQFYLVSGMAREEGTYDFLVEMNYYTYMNISTDDTFYVYFSYFYNMSIDLLVETYLDFYSIDTTGYVYAMNSEYSNFWASGAPGYTYYDFAWTAPQDGKFMVEASIYVDGVYVDGFEYKWTAGGHLKSLDFSYWYDIYDSDGDANNDSIDVNLSFSWNESFPPQDVFGWVDLYYVTSDGTLFFMDSAYFSFYASGTSIQYFGYTFNVIYAGDYEVHLEYGTFNESSGVTVISAPDLFGDPLPLWDVIFEHSTYNYDGVGGDERVEFSLQIRNYNITEFSGEGNVTISRIDPVKGPEIVYSASFPILLYAYNFFFFNDFFDAPQAGDYFVSAEGLIGGEPFSTNFTVYLEARSGDYVNVDYKAVGMDWDNNGLMDYIDAEAYIEWDYNTNPRVELQFSLYKVEADGQEVWIEDLYNDNDGTPDNSIGLYGQFYIQEEGNYTVYFSAIVDGSTRAVDTFYFYFMEVYTGPILWYAQDAYPTDEDGFPGDDSIFFWLEYNYNEGSSYDYTEMELYIEFNLYKMTNGQWTYVDSQSFSVILNGTVTDRVSGSFNLPYSGDYAIEMRSKTLIGFDFYHFQEFRNLNAFQKDSPSDGTTDDTTPSNESDVPSLEAPPLPVPFAIDIVPVALLVSLPVVRRRRR